MRVAESVPADDDLTALLRRFELPLLQYATRILGDRERARDVVQETFVELQRSPRRQLDHAPAKWLFTVCRNRALNVCRKEKRMSYLDEELLEKCESHEPAPNEHIEREEASGFLLRIVATLPPRQQEVLQLKFQNDLSYPRTLRNSVAGCLAGGRDSVEPEGRVDLTKDRSPPARQAAFC